MKKLFFWRDKSGRRGAAPQTEDDLKQSELYKDGDNDWNGRTLEEFIDQSEVGDQWEDNANEITRTS